MAASAIVALPEKTPIIVRRNPRKFPRLRFTLCIANREAGHYVVYPKWPREGFQHWYLTKCAAVILLLLGSAAAQPPIRRLPVGMLQFRGTNDPACGEFCRTAYDVLLAPPSANPLALGDVVVCIGAVCQHSGPVQTRDWDFCNCIDLTFPAGELGDVLPDCVRVPCRSIDVQLVSVDGRPFTLTLLNGTTFVAASIDTTVLKALPGQHVLKPGQSVPIDLALDRSRRRFTADNLSY